MTLSPDDRLTFLFKFLETYEYASSSTTALSSLVFGASVFLAMRGMGIVKDKDIVPIIGLRWLVIAAGLAILSITLGFLVQGALAGFLSDVQKMEFKAHCDSADVFAYFDSCTRKPALRFIFGGALLSSLMACYALLYWFYQQVKGQRL